MRGISCCTASFYTVLWFFFLPKSSVLILSIHQYSYLQPLSLYHSFPFVFAIQLVTIHKNMLCLTLLTFSKPLFFYSYASFYFILNLSPDTAVLYHSLSLCSLSVTVSCKSLPSLADLPISCLSVCISCTSIYWFLYVCTCLTTMLLVQLHYIIFPLYTGVCWPMHSPISYE